MSETPKPESTGRLAFVDQLRGYAIFGMLLVNAKGLFFKPIAPSLEGTSFQSIFESILYQISHHRTNFTYADTIAPLFVFVVGMGMRLSWLRRTRRANELEPQEVVREARKALAKRYMLLVLIAFAIYAGWLWDALMDIGLAGLLAVYLIDKKPAARIAWAFIYLLAYQLIFMFTSYGTWLMEGKFSLTDPEYVPVLVQMVPLYSELFDVTLNGGPLGPLSWVMMLLFGSYAYDLVAARDEKKLVVACLAWGAGLCVMAYALQCPWPGVKEVWPFSARYMTAPFPLWSTGLCFLQLLVFYVICQKLNLRIPTFTSVGMNPLAIYIFQSLFLGVMESFEPERFSLLTGLVGFALFWGAISGVAYYLHRRKIYIKL